MKDHGKETILEHLKIMLFRWIETTKSRSALKQEQNYSTVINSFRVHGDFDKTHLLNIPGEINAFRVLRLKLIIFIETNYTIFSGYLRCD